MLTPRAPDVAVRAAYYSGFAPEVDAAFSTYGLGWHYDAGVHLAPMAQDHSGIVTGNVASA